MSVIRTWHCMNGRCGGTFDSWEANPECPSCHGVRVEWVPAGGHVGGTAKGADKELRALADIFRMNDMNSAEAGRAAKKVSLPDAPKATPANVHNFGGGFMAAVNPAAGAQCVPVANKIDYKVKATPGQSISPNGIFPGVRSHTVVEASHKQ